MRERGGTEERREVREGKSPHRRRSAAAEVPRLRMSNEKKNPNLLAGPIIVLFFSLVDGFLIS